ncbi:uncharacterized protein LOC112691561 isoform X2 [Sipha flava]|uniref:Uncharacterized protein LOC112691561 isoform X2 n=1 Tax=Sipha flava TaxID=143950 RepID=A0A2S2QMX3_9HEMI|nr:uncharacterized protein LOC112691561 isoform X2 [Sipha flava]
MGIQIKEKMNNKNYWKKKDIIVIFINFTVLFLVVYIYYVVDELRTLFSKEKLCVLKPSSMRTLTDDNIDELYFDKFKSANQYVKSRHTRSSDSVKFQHSSLFFLAQPNTDFEQNGILGPWILSNKSVSVDNHPIKLTSRRTLLEIVDEGFYLLYIQVYYLSSSKRNSFAITKITSDVNETLSVCSAMGVYGTEISCFTSLMEHFKTGDSILIRLREMSLNINLSRRVSHTYLGLVKLL